MNPARALSSALRPFGPAMGETSWRELARAAVGTALAIMLCDLTLWALRHSTPALPGGTGDPLREVILVSSFAASAFLILTVPNSPLAQPWSVIFGNSLGAAVGMICALWLPFPVLAAACAVGLSVLAMAAVRALHPPGAAMALNTVLLSFSGGDTGPVFVLATVMAGSMVLVVFGMVFNALTGRRYPFRPPTETLPAEAAYLADLLERSRLSANIGVADLSRLIATVEAEATAHHLGHMSAAGMMTPAPLTLGPETPLAEVRSAFANHPHHAIPVAKDGVYLGLLPQTALMDASDGVLASDLMQAVAALSPEDELPAILLRLTSGRERILPVTQGDVLVGIISRADLIGVLARALRNPKD